MADTIQIDEQLLREAQQVAARAGKSVQMVIEDALRESLARHRAAQKREPVKLPTFKGAGLLPGVDLNNTSALLDLMDFDDPH